MNHESMLQFIEEYPNAWMTANHFSLSTLLELTNHAPSNIKSIIQEAVTNYQELINQ